MDPGWKPTPRTDIAETKDGQFSVQRDGPDLFVVYDRKSNELSRHTDEVEAVMEMWRLWEFGK
jgi:hypothetical protein